MQLCWVHLSLYGVLWSLLAGVSPVSVELPQLVLPLEGATLQARACPIHVHLPRCTSVLNVQDVLVHVLASDGGLSQAGVGLSQLGTQVDGRLALALLGNRELHVPFIGGRCALHIPKEWKPLFRF